jgi:pimeloyl-ACP methyl ester carboxylesterase
MNDTERALANTLGIPYEIKQETIMGHHINSIRCGGGRPLLLLHGANFGWGVWYPNIRYLAKRYTVYALDLPGSGRSSLVEYNSLDVERDVYHVVRAWVETQGLRDCTVIGCSVGGWIALKLALEVSADRIRSVIVENTVGFADYMGRGDKMIGWYPLARTVARTILRTTPDNRRNIEKFLRGIFFDHDLAIRSEFLDYFFETQARSHNLLFISRMTACAEQFFLMEKLPSLMRPVLIAWGKEDRIMPFEKNKNGFSLIKGAEVVTIDRAGHIPSFEQPEAFHTAVDTFLMEK